MHRLCQGVVFDHFRVVFQFNWLGVDFNNWKDWADDSEEDLSSFDKFSDVSTLPFG